MSAVDLSLIERSIADKETVLVIGLLSDCAYCKALMAKIDLDFIKRSGIEVIICAVREMTADLRIFEARFGINVWPSCWLYRQGRLVGGLLPDHSTFQNDLRDRIIYWIYNSVMSTLI